MPATRSLRLINEKFHKKNLTLSISQNRVLMTDRHRLDLGEHAITGLQTEASD